MTVTDWIGALGVSFLLVAFFLNLVGRLGKDGFPYLFLNVTGAGLACLASILLRYWPFIILEGCWTLVSLAHLLRPRRS